MVIRDSYYSGDGKVYANTTGGSYSETSGGATYTSADTIGVTLDLDSNKLKYYKNGVLQDSITQSITSGKEWCFMVRSFFSENNNSNFGQKPFKYAPPDGFQPLNTANLRPDKVISRPDKYVGIVTYTGTGTTPQSISGLNFDDKPDVVWIKDYTSSSNYSYRIADSVRGSTKVLFTNATNGTQTNEYGTIDKFTFNGFDLRQGSNNNGDGSNTNGSVVNMHVITDASNRKLFAINPQTDKSN